MDVLNRKLKSIQIRDNNELSQLKKLVFGNESSFNIFEALERYQQEVSFEKETYMDLGPEIQYLIEYLGNLLQEAIATRDLKLAKQFLKKTFKFVTKTLPSVL